MPIAAKPWAIDRRPMPSAATLSCPFTSAARTINASLCNAGSETLKSSRIASKLQREPRWLSFTASIRGASKGTASWSFACSTKSFSSTNRNSACGSTKRLISQGQATRSTFTSLRVIHFIVASRSPGISELDDEAVLVVLGRIFRNQAGKALARSIDNVKIAVGTVIPAQANIGAGCLVVGGVHLNQGRERQEARE